MLEQLVVPVVVADAATAAAQRVFKSQQKRRHPQRGLANWQRNERTQIHSLQKRQRQLSHGSHFTASELVGR